MFAAPVVGHPVVDHANPTPVGFLEQASCSRPKCPTEVDLVAVRACVAVVGGFGKVVFHDRRHPNGSDAQIFQIPQTIGHPLKVSTVPRVHLTSVHPAFLGAFDVVVVGIAVGKPVGHDQIHGWNRLPLVQPIASIQQRIHMDGDVLLEPRWSTKSTQHRQMFPQHSRPTRSMRDLAIVQLAIPRPPPVHLRMSLRSPPPIRPLKPTPRHVLARGLPTNWEDRHSVGLTSHKMH